MIALELFVRLTWRHADVVDHPECARNQVRGSWALPGRPYGRVLCDGRVARERSSFYRSNTRQLFINTVYNVVSMLVLGLIQNPRPVYSGAVSETAARDSAASKPASLRLALFWSLAIGPRHLSLNMMLAPLRVPVAHRISAFFALLGRPNRLRPRITPNIERLGGRQALLSNKRRAIKLPQVRNTCQSTAKPPNPPHAAFGS